MKRQFILVFSVLILNSCDSSLPDELKEEIAQLPERLDYNMDVKPILSDKCFACHGPDKKKQKAGLRLDIAENAFDDLPENPGKVAIDPGDLTDSEVFHRIMTSNPKKIMPTPESHLTLSTKEKAVLVKWIQDGAEYKPHWAFEKPEKPSIPSVDDDDWIKNDIDNLVLSKLESRKIKPQKEADKETLLRRVYLDLTGLPPTIAEMDAFLADKSENAYEKVVDKLLKSKHFGEKMATDWMDVSRFADSHGYTVDRVRDMSPYRDWVIRAFNENLPYSKFIEYQIAGDLLPNSTIEQKIATGFLRNHQQNMEGGIVEEEFRVEYVMDRTSTVGTAFLGLTLECSKCHDHKYDPLTQKNFYEMSSFFNNVNEAGQISWDNAPPVPTLQLPTTEQEKVIKFIETKLQSVEQNKGYPTKINQEFNQWISSEKYKQDLVNQSDTVGLQGYFTFDNSIKNLRNKAHQPKMTREIGGTENDIPVYAEGKFNKSLLMDGDLWFDSHGVGAFHRYEPFTISLWVNVPKNLTDGVILHRGDRGLLYNFRGYHLQFKKNKLEFNLARTAPDNAIIVHSKTDIPRNQWIHLTISYDGSSKASGAKIYLNGQSLQTDVIVDNLTKDIAFFSKNQFTLQLGAWGRGKGFKDGKIDEVKVYNRLLVPYEITNLAGKTSWTHLLAKPYNALSQIEKEGLKGYFISAKSPSAKQWLNEITAIRKAKNDSTENINEMMVMKEMQKPRQAYILERGGYDNHGEKVFPNTPESILEYDSDFPKNRIGLAQWLTNEDNPLTARVTVNRYWQMFFGVGIVKTAEDFGNQGELPSNKDLLDYLAVDFIENDWNAKELCKKIVLSATYRQSSKASIELLKSDPENRLMARGPTNRLSAEMIRDNALVASGLYKNQIGGKSMKPYQPEGLWAINGDTYVPDSTDDIYRRSLYILIKRSVPHPTLATFDATARSSCTVRRQKTNTPLQSLTLMNDPTFIETCKVMGQTMTKEGNSSKSIESVFRKITGRKPIKSELDLLLTQQQSAYKKFKENPIKKDSWIKTGLYKIDDSLDKDWVAANTIVANTILNSEASIIKR
jgi:hypothetical protein